MSYLVIQKEKRTRKVELRVAGIDLATRDFFKLLN